MAADTIFNKTGVDIFLMEYDTETADLSHFDFSQGKRECCQVYYHQKSELESMEALKRQVDEASKFADMDSLG